MKTSIIVVLLVMLSGCAMAPVTYYRNGTTQSEFNTDSMECQYEATKYTQGVAMGYNTAFVQALDQAMRRRQLYDQCMRVRGYTSR